MRAERCDITRASDVARIVDLMEHELGGIDILVNRCRHKGRSDSLAIEPEHWDSVLDVNLKSVFFCPQAVAQSMVRRDRPGRVRRSTARSCSRTAWRTAAARAGSGR
ncbi:SDR family NAD(P)-dependent oxidoreductase [Rhodococcus opacus]|uniref:SDR family NAD(P)-dependent oxidoreductase n=1 Tax=Rhodococcus opacus TaxID=37919 RepID=UPI00155A0C29